MSTITAVIVSYNEEPAQLRAAVDSLLAQTRPPVEVLVMDNQPARDTAAVLAGYPAHVRRIECPTNPGYAALNEAAVQAVGEHLLCLNPDARAHVHCLERLAAVADADANVGLVGAQILLEDGQTRNAGANPLHPTGISPSGGYGEPCESGAPRDAIVVSGACFLARREAFLALGGFVEEFFLYYEDVDLGWRTRIAGLRVVYCPEARVTHSYDAGASPWKWFLLERNRLFSVLANYELRTLLLYSPLLLATEAGLLAVAARGGWLAAKLRTYRSLLALRTRLGAQRRAVQLSRRRSDGQLLSFFDERIDSPLISRAGARLANLFCVPYLSLVRHALR